MFCEHKDGLWLAIMHDCASPCCTRQWVMRPESELFSFFTMDGSTSLYFISLPCGEQKVAQDNSFTHFFIIKPTDNRSNSFKREFHIFFLLQKHFSMFRRCSFTYKNEVWGYACEVFFSQLITIALKIAQE